MLFINFKEIFEGKVAIVEVEGPLDSQTSPNFEDYLNQFLAKKIFFILFDFKKLTYLSSEGIGSILYVQQKISEKNGYVIIFNHSSEINSLFKVIGFNQIFRLSKNKSEALQIMDRQIELRYKKEKNNSEFIKSNFLDFKPFIIKCLNCDSYLRIKSKGDFLCPTCEASFTVKPNQMVLF